MKKIIVALAMSIPYILIAQDFSSKGIRWMSGFTWDEVKHRASQENKYIFVDCYATWCGPCKEMDKAVYSIDTVGNYFNDKFISVKVQMNKTKTDNQDIRTWYATVEEFAKRYKILVYPTYVFFSPQGKVVLIETGYKTPSQFLDVAKAAITPGKVFNDPYAEYSGLVENYKRGEKNYSRMAYMVKTAFEIGDTTILKELVVDYRDYVLTLSDSQLYTKSNIEFFSLVMNSSKSKIFPLFLSQISRIDSVMLQKGFAESKIDYIIKKEEIQPRLKLNSNGMQAKVSHIENRPEPDWIKLYDTIKQKYNDRFADRIILDTKSEWYYQQHRYEEWAKNIIVRFTTYGIDMPQYPQSVRLNWVCWDMFLNVNDKKCLKVATKWLKDTLTNNNLDSVFYPLVLDTYASLLYKIGKRHQALIWENKALQSTTREKDSLSFQSKIQKMKRREIIWSSK